MAQDIYMSESNLRCELGRLRVERHELERQIREAHAHLHFLNRQRQQNLRDINALEKQLSRCFEGLCPIGLATDSFALGKRLSIQHYVLMFMLLAVGVLSLVTLYT